MTGAVPVAEDMSLGGLRPAGAVAMSEGIRDDAIETVRFLNRQGTALKVISGDATETVQAVADACGVPGAELARSGADLPDEPGALESVADETVVFGRITPEQKRELVAALARRGRYVAMIGDGVNDVLALKEARLAIAMGSGSQIAKGVSDLVLLRGGFGTVPPAIEEGRRIIRNTHRVAKLFVTKTVYAAVLLATIGLAPIAFPFLPRHLTVTASLTIGIPAFFLALAPSSGPVRRDRFMRDLLAFTVPAGLITAAAIIAGYLTVRGPLDGDVIDGRTSAVMIATAMGLAVVVVLERRAGGGRAFVGVGHGRRVRALLHPRPARAAAAGVLRGEPAHPRRLAGHRAHRRGRHRAAVGGPRKAAPQRLTGRHPCGFSVRAIRDRADEAEAGGSRTWRRSTREEVGRDGHEGARGRRRSALRDRRATGDATCPARREAARS